MDSKTRAYFPPYVDEFRQDWYSANLKAMTEPSLFGEDSDASDLICRCLWLRSCRPSICVRVERASDGGVSVFAKEITCDAIVEPATLVKAAHKEINTASLEEVTRMLESMKFWDLPTNEEIPFGLDGERWIFEVRQSTRYNVVDRFCPDVIERDRPLVELGEYLLSLAEAQNVDRQTA